MTRRAAPGLVLVILAVLGLGAPVVASGSPAAARTAYQPWAHVHEPDGVLLHGCHRYRYSYRVTTPSQDWLVELTLFNPNHHKIGSAYLASESEPRRGHKAWMICRPSTPAGRFTVRIKVTDGSAPGPTRTAAARPAHFRLTRS